MDFINDVTLKDSKIDFEFFSDKFASISAACVAGAHTLHLDANGPNSSILIDSEGYVDIESGKAIRNYSCRGIINAAYNGISFISDGIDYGGQINFVSNYCASRPDRKPNINFFVTPELNYNSLFAFDCNGCLSQNTVEPQVQFTIDSLNFNLPSVFSDSIQVGSMIGGGCGDSCGNSCGCGTDGSYGLYVDSNSFTYDNGSQYIDFNPLTGMQFSSDAGCVGIIDFKFSKKFSIDGFGPACFQIHTGCAYVNTSEFKLDLTNLQVNTGDGFEINAIDTSIIDVCSDLTIRGGNSLGTGCLHFGSGQVGNRDIILKHGFKCITVPENSGRIIINSCYGNVRMSTGSVADMWCGSGCGAENAYINLDKSGIQLGSDGMFFAQVNAMQFCVSDTLEITSTNFSINSDGVNVCKSLTAWDRLDVLKDAEFCSPVSIYEHLKSTHSVSFTGSKCATSKFVSDIPATFNKKAIFNDGICTKSITSIAGTQIFDTTDGKGFNFKGLYTLNGFGTTNKPFFKQESATNNWIDVTTLKEGGTALADKYALKTDIPAEVDVSNKADKATTLAGYGITDAYTKSEIDSKNVSFLTKESSGIQTVSSDLALTGYVLIDNLSIDELEIESLTASSKVTLSGGLEVSNGLVADSIKVGSDTVALAKNIPNVSSFITKDVSNLTNYETKTTTEGKYALKTSLSSYALKTDISNVYKYIGSVNTAAELPSNLTAADSGKVYNIVNESTSGDLKVSAGDNVAWTGSSWDKLGGSVDLSNYAQKATTLAGYGITDAYTKTEADANNITFLKKESSGIQTVSSDLALTGYVLIDNLAIDELNIESLTATSKVTLSGGLEVSNGLVADSIKIGNDTVALAKNIPNVSSFITKDVSNLTNYETKTTAEGKYALKTDIPDISDVKTPIFKYFQNPVIPASCSLFAIATNAEFENMPMMQLVRNSDNTIVSADISWKSNSNGGHDIMVGIDHSTQINANTYTLQAFGY